MPKTIIPDQGQDDQHSDPGVIDPVMVGVDALTDSDDHPGYYVAELDGRAQIIGTLDQLEGIAFSLLAMVSSARLSRGAR